MLFIDVFLFVLAVNDDKSFVFIGISHDFLEILILNRHELSSDPAGYY